MSFGQAETFLNLDMVDEACREMFELAWLTGNRKPISDCLPQPDSDRYTATLEELICIQMELQWKAASRARTLSGQRIDCTTLTDIPMPVEAYMAEFPVVKERVILRRLIRQEFLLRQRSGDSPAAADYSQRFPDVDTSTLLSSDALLTADGLYESKTDRVSAAVLPDPIEGYELLEQIGTGAMGAVYRARQLAADRIVALKVIRADRLVNVSAAARTEVLQRFQIEAQAAARLEHPNIVSVFEVNTTNPLQPWFSMQLVDGKSLAEHLASGPLECPAAADFSFQITSAIAAAHANGILHRDLKPHNVFVRSDGCRLLVGDFGLAKFSVDDSQRTSADEILGTPAYMSPEQIRNAAEVTEATDVWSVGATLYHMLTGRPPFQAASSMDTLRQVLDHQPTSPRSLNPDVDRDIETICLKCLRKNPQHRYSSAQALTFDLELYRNGMPITARPVSRLQHVWRWCRRSPLPAALAASVVVAVAIAVISLWVGYRTAADALTESDVSHRLARQTVNDLLTEVSETVLLDRPGLQPLRRRLHERALGYYRKFVQSGHDTPEVQQELADVWYRIGRIEKELGRPQEAANAFVQARIRQQRLVERDSTMPRRQALASTWNAIGSLKIAEGEWDAAANALLRALELREQLVREAPENTEFRRLFANTTMNLGAVHRNRGESTDAVKLFRRAAAVQEVLLAEGQLPPDVTRLVRRDLGMALYNSANASFDIAIADVGSEVLQPVSRAQDLFTQLLVDQPDSYTDRRRVILCRQLRAEADPDPESAVLAAVAAADEMQQLVRENPAVPSLLNECGQLQLLSGRLYAECGNHSLALLWFDRAIAGLTRALQDPSALSSPDLSVATAEAALAAIHLDHADAQRRLMIARERLTFSLAQTADAEAYGELLMLVEDALQSDIE